ncbi:TetR family transcriptional regulator [Shouchella clausii]|uniref:TetR/AcrR family transcriptional regulator n=1 Tax=Shouchella tritolerans TaxID=2979466 RepID=UPI000788B441|nr:TetR/AcrR family transcriptional regulator [Shouchella tritolerans]GIN12662.1 TetR family transcriptional regulator [Shouchella clausii]
MSKQFESLEKEKQVRILDAAFHEFAENGYESASTNRIVKAAGIAKGTLFNYFENKQSLYHYLINYAIDLSREQYLQKIDVEEADFFERLKKAGTLKWKVFKEHEKVLNFLATLGLSVDEIELPKPLRMKFEELLTYWHRVLNDNIDYSKFRDDVDVRKAFHLIRWSIEGYRSELMQRFKGENLNEIDTEPFYDEYYQYIDILKTCFYRKEEVER